MIQKREKLIHEVSINGSSLAFIANKLKIKLSTARMILKKYKEEGQFRTKNFKNKRNTDLYIWGTSKNVQNSKLAQNHSNTPERTDFIDVRDKEAP